MHASLRRQAGTAIRSGRLKSPPTASPTPSSPPSSVSSNHLVSREGSERVVVSSSKLDFRPLPGRTAANPFAGHDAGGLSMRVVHLDAGAARSPHRHPRSHEAIYVVEGRGHFWEDGRARRG